jgi:hypothetical protein
MNMQIQFTDNIFDVHDTNEYMPTAFADKLVGWLVCKDQQEEFIRNFWPATYTVDDEHLCTAASERKHTTTRRIKLLGTRDDTYFVLRRTANSHYEWISWDQGIYLLDKHYKFKSSILENKDSMTDFQKLKYIAKRKQITEMEFLIRELGKQIAKAGLKDDDFLCIHYLLRNILYKFECDEQLILLNVSTFVNNVIQEYTELIRIENALINAIKYIQYLCYEKESCSIEFDLTNKYDSRKYILIGTETPGQCITLFPAIGNQPGLCRYVKEARVLDFTKIIAQEITKINEPSNNDTYEIEFFAGIEKAQAIHSNMLYGKINIHDQYNFNEMAKQMCKLMIYEMPVNKYKALNTYTDEEQLKDEHFKKLFGYYSHGNPPFNTYINKEMSLADLNKTYSITSIELVQPGMFMQILENNIEGTEDITRSSAPTAMQYVVPVNIKPNLPNDLKLLKRYFNNTHRDYLFLSKYISWTPGRLVPGFKENNA